MLNNLSEQVRECLEAAENCAHKAAAAKDPKIKQDYLDLERSWVKLARSFQTGERLTEFNNQFEPK